MSETERLTVAALAMRLGAKPETVRKRLARIQAGKAKPWPWLAGMERGNSGEWTVIMDPTGLVPDLSRTSALHLSDLRAEVDAARAQIVNLTRLLDREITDRRALQEQVDQAREQLHLAQVAAATAETRPGSASDQLATMQREDLAAAEAMAFQLARLWQRWWWGAAPNSQ